MTALEMELAVARHFGVRSNLVVPNVSWGMPLDHEADIIACTKSRYCTEVEIKVSVSDLRRDFKKKHMQTRQRVEEMQGDGPNPYQQLWEARYNWIKEFYYAVPIAMAEKTKALVKPEVGLLIVDRREETRWKYRGDVPEPVSKHMTARVVDVRPAQVNKGARPLTDAEYLQLLRLGALRIWGLKQKVLDPREAGGKISQCRAETLSG